MRRGRGGFRPHPGEYFPSPLNVNINDGYAE